MTTRRPRRHPELVFQRYVLDATALIDFERSSDLRRRLSNPGDAVLVPFQVKRQVTKTCRSPLCRWFERHQSTVTRCRAQESALAITLAQKFAALIDAPDAEAIAIAWGRQAILVTGERATKMPEVAAQHGVDCVTPAQFLCQWLGAARRR